MEPTHARPAGGFARQSDRHDAEPGSAGRDRGGGRGQGGALVVDEIYHGLTYGEDARTALAVDAEVFVINSFSKYFGMTGWRLGWLVVPPRFLRAVEKLAQNLYICASSLSQAAALACFEPDSMAEYERRRSAFRARRDFVVPALERLGLRVPVFPDGAFYAYADTSAHATSSWDLCFDLMRRAQVALTPGRDFGPYAGERFLRLSFASAMPQLEEAVERLHAAL